MNQLQESNSMIMDLCIGDRQRVHGLVKMDLKTDERILFENIMKPVQTGCRHKVQVGKELNLRISMLNSGIDTYLRMYQVP